MKALSEQYRNIIEKYVVCIVFIATIFISVPEVRAGITFPQCKWDEITVLCNCPHADNVCADNTCSECLTYKNDPRYYYLWQDVYCRKASIMEMITKYKYSFFIPLLTIIALESIVFAIKGFRKKHELLSLAFINIISFFVGILFLRIYSLIYRMLPFQIPNIPFSLYGMDVPRLISLFITGTLMTVFEIVVLIRIVKTNDSKKVIVTAIIANIVSLVLGLGILNAVYPHFLQPRIF